MGKEGEEMKLPEFDNFFRDMFALLGMFFLGVLMCAFLIEDIKRPEWEATARLIAVQDFYQVAVVKEAAKWKADKNGAPEFRWNQPCTPHLGVKEKLK